MLNPGHETTDKQFKQPRTRLRWRRCHLNQGAHMNITRLPQASMTLSSQKPERTTYTPEDSRVIIDSALDDYTVTVGLSWEEQAAFDYRVALEHREAPMRKAGSAMQTIEKALGALQKSIARERPGLTEGSWDLSINKEGKLEAIGALSNSDKAWLNDKLQGQDKLKVAVKSFMKAAETYLETTADNPGYHAQNLHNGRILHYNFMDVTEQLSGTIGFKELFQTTMEHFKGARFVDADTGGDVDPSPELGMQALEVLASRLTPHPD